MKIFSEKTKEFYPSVDECLAAEEQYDAEQAKLAAEKEAQAKIRKERADEVGAAYKAYEEARQNYVELRNKFVEDFGSYHMTIRTKSPTVGTLEDFISRFF